MNNKRILTILTGIILVITTISPVIVSQDNNYKEYILTINYNFKTPEISTNDNIAKVSINDCIFRHIPGEPLVPMYSTKILLPQGKDINNIVLTYRKPILLDSNLVLEHSQNPTMIGKTPEFTEPNQEIYESDEPYPNTLYDVTGISGIYGFNILNINLYPIRYIPKAGKILYYPDMTVKVILKEGAINPLFRGDSADTQRVEDIVDNPHVTSTYGDTNFGEGFLSSADYDYVIITSTSFLDDFQPLLNHKNMYTTTNIVDTSYINSNFAGIDLQEKIRNFITDAYLNWGTTYVLLGGDVEIIPYRGMYGYVPTSPATVDYNIPVDMYYGALDGDWNADGDSNWGEYSDSPDYFVEVFIGRAPVNTESEVSNFINKVISFETSAKPTKVQLHQSRLRSGNIPDSRTISEECAQWIPPSYTIDKLYEEDGTVTKSDWINAFNWGPLIIQHSGHGWYNSYDLNYENGGHVSWYNSDALGLSNNFYPIHTSLACLSGAFDDNDCLAEAYMLSENGGASACMLNSREGWFYTSYAAEPTGAFIEQEFWEIFQNGTEPLGKIMQFAKEYLVGYVTPNTGDASCWRWCYYEINLLGDPESPVLTQRGGNQAPKCTITADPTSGDASLTTTFTMTADDTDGTIDHWELDVDNDGIYEYTDFGIPTTQAHTYNDPGIYTAELTVWDNDGATGTDTTIITVTEPNIPPDTPSNPNPPNGASNIGLNPSLSVYVNDDNGDVLTVSFYDNLNNLIGTDTVTGSGTASTFWSGVDQYQTDYYWYVEADDGEFTSTSATWMFTTMEQPNTPPDTPSSPYPADDAINIELSPTLSVYVNDADGDTMTVLFYEQGGPLIGTDTIIGSGTATTTWSNADQYSTTYDWYVTADDGEDQTTATIWQFTTIPEPNQPPNTPTNPNPIGGAIDIDLSPTLSVYVSDPNGDLMDVTFYDEFGATIGSDLNVPSGSYASSVWNNLDPSTTYGWYTTADDNRGGTSTSGSWYFTTTNTPPPQKYYANSETAITSSSIIGSCIDTQSSDNTYEGISEKKTGPRSQLEHKWTIIIPGGYEAYTFNVEAYHTANIEGDNFIFAYSTDNNIYHDLITVNKINDDNTAQSYTLPNTITGTIYIQVRDTDQTKGNNGIDTIYIDEMYIEVSGTPPENRPPNTPIDPSPSPGALNVDINPILSVYVQDPDNDNMDVTFYNANTGLPIGIDYSVASGSYASFEWSNLDFEKSYSWYVIADDSKETSTSDTWSFTTRSDTPPTDMYVSDISWSVRTAGKNLFLSHIVTVMSAEGVVSGATVYSTLTNTDTGKRYTFSGITDATGKVTFERKCKPGPYEAIVTDMTYTTYTYNPALDLDNPDTYNLA